MENQVDPILWHAQVYNTKAVIQTTISAVLLECFWTKKKEPENRSRLEELLLILEQARQKFEPQTFKDRATMVSVCKWCEEVQKSFISKD